MDIKLTRSGTVYSLKHTDDVRKKSTSGGAFTAISDVILKHNGFICGALYGENMEVVHRVVNNASERDRMRGSKYTQSDLNTVPEQIADLLEKGNCVLFVGTPCQVSAMNLYLKERKVCVENFFTCDFVCHGVPSPQLTKEYFSLVAGKRKLREYSFRDKSNGWHAHVEKPFFEGTEQKYNIWLTRANVYLFGTHNATRPCCYSCKYASVNRVSDITIGDCWGIDKVDPSSNDDKGLSLLMVNSDKGKKIIEEIAESVVLKEYRLEELLQPRLQGGFPVPKTREEFWKYYAKNGLEKTLKKYAMYGLKGKVWFYTAKAVRKMGLTKVIKKVVQRK